MPALRALAADLSERTGIACEVAAEEGVEARLARESSDCVYRVAKETLGNAARHSRARRVMVDLWTVSPGRAALRVADDGLGMPARDAGGGRSFGLVGMEERARAVGGELRVVSESGRGTTVELEVPAAAGGGSP